MTHKSRIHIDPAKKIDKADRELGNELRQLSPSNLAEHRRKQVLDQTGLGILSEPWIDLSSYGLKAVKTLRSVGRNLVNDVCILPANGDSLDDIAPGYAEKLQELGFVKLAHVGANAAYGDSSKMTPGFRITMSKLKNNPDVGGVAGLLKHFPNGKEMIADGASNYFDTTSLLNKSLAETAKQVRYQQVQTIIHDNRGKSLTVSPASGNFRKISEEHQNYFRSLLTGWLPSSTPKFFGIKQGYSYPKSLRNMVESALTDHNLTAPLYFFEHRHDNMVILSGHPMHMARLEDRLQEMFGNDSDGNPIWPPFDDYACGIVIRKNEIPLVEKYIPDLLQGVSEFEGRMRIDTSDQNFNGRKDLAKTIPDFKPLTRVSDIEAGMVNHQFEEPYEFYQRVYASNPDQILSDIPEIYDEFGDFMSNPDDILKSGSGWRLTVRDKVDKFKDLSMQASIAYSSFKLKDSDGSMVPVDMPVPLLSVFGGSSKLPSSENLTPGRKEGQWVLSGRVMKAFLQYYQENRQYRRTHDKVLAQEGVDSLQRASQTTTELLHRIETEVSESSLEGSYALTDNLRAKSQMYNDVQVEIQRHDALIRDRETGLPIIPPESYFTRRGLKEAVKGLSGQLMKGSDRRGEYYAYPLLDENFKPAGINRIYNDGQKIFSSGNKGLFAIIKSPAGGKAPKEIFVSEGIATTDAGAQVFDSANAMHVSCCSAGNMERTIQALKTRYPKAAINIIADNDAYKPHAGNTGLRAAIDAAIAFDCNVYPAPVELIPDNKSSAKPGTDLDDVINSIGADAVREHVADKANWIEPGEGLWGLYFKQLPTSPVRPPEKSIEELEDDLATYKAALETLSESDDSASIQELQDNIQRSQRDLQSAKDFNDYHQLPKEIERLKAEQEDIKQSGAEDNGMVAAQIKAYTTTLGRIERQLDEIRAKAVKRAVAHVTSTTDPVKAYRSTREIMAMAADAMGEGFVKRKLPSLIDYLPSIVAPTFEDMHKSVRSVRYQTKQALNASVEGSRPLEINDLVISTYPNSKGEVNQIIVWSPTGRIKEAEALIREAVAPAMVMAHTALIDDPENPGEKIKTTVGFRVSHQFEAKLRSSLAPATGDKELYFTMQSMPTPDGGVELVSVVNGPVHKHAQQLIDTEIDHNGIKEKAFRYDPQTNRYFIGLNKQIPAETAALFQSRKTRNNAPVKTEHIVKSMERTRSLMSEKQGKDFSMGVATSSWSDFGKVLESVRENQTGGIEFLIDGNGNPVWDLGNNLLTQSWLRTLNEQTADTPIEDRVPHSIVQKMIDNRMVIKLDFEEYGLTAHSRRYLMGENPSPLPENRLVDIAEYMATLSARLELGLQPLDESLLKNKALGLTSTDSELVVELVQDHFGITPNQAKEVQQLAKQIISSQPLSLVAHRYVGNEAMDDFEQMAHDRLSNEGLHYRANGLVQLSFERHSIEPGEKEAVTLGDRPAALLGNYNEKGVDRGLADLPRFTAFAQGENMDAPSEDLDWFIKAMSGNSSITRPQIGVEAIEGKLDAMPSWKVRLLKGFVCASNENSAEISDATLIARIRTVAFMNHPRINEINERNKSFDAAHLKLKGVNEGTASERRNHLQSWLANFAVGKNGVNDSKAYIDRLQQLAIKSNYLARATELENDGFTLAPEIRTEVIEIIRQPIMANGSDSVAWQENNNSLSIISGSMANIAAFNGAEQPTSTTLFTCSAEMAERLQAAGRGVLVRHPATEGDSDIKCIELNNMPAPVHMDQFGLTPANSETTRAALNAVEQNISASPVSDRMHAFSFPVTRGDQVVTRKVLIAYSDKDAPGLRQKAGWQAQVWENGVDITTSVLTPPPGRELINDYPSNNRQFMHLLSGRQSGALGQEPLDAGEVAKLVNELSKANSSPQYIPGETVLDDIQPESAESVEPIESVNSNYIDAVRLAVGKLQKHIDDRGRPTANASLLIDSVLRTIGESNQDKERVFEVAYELQASMPHDIADEINSTLASEEFDSWIEAKKVMGGLPQFKPMAVVNEPFGLTSSMAESHPPSVAEWRGLSESARSAILNLEYRRNRDNPAVPHTVIGDAMLLMTYVTHRDAPLSDRTKQDLERIMNDQEMVNLFTQNLGRVMVLVNVAARAAGVQVDESINIELANPKADPTKGRQLYVEDDSIITPAEHLPLAMMTLDQMEELISEKPKNQRDQYRQAAAIMKELFRHPSNKHLKGAGSEAHAEAILKHEVKHAIINNNLVSESGYNLLSENELQSAIQLSNGINSSIDVRSELMVAERLLKKDPAAALQASLDKGPFSAESRVIGSRIMNEEAPYTSLSHYAPEAPSGIFIRAVNGDDRAIQFIAMDIKGQPLDEVFGSPIRSFDSVADLVKNYNQDALSKLTPETVSVRRLVDVLNRPPQTDIEKIIAAQAQHMIKELGVSKIDCENMIKALPKDVSIFAGADGYTVERREAGIRHTLEIGSDVLAEIRSLGLKAEGVSRGLQHNEMIAEEINIILEELALDGVTAKAENGGVRFLNDIDSPLLKTHGNKPVVIADPLEAREVAERISLMLRLPEASSPYTIEFNDVADPDRLVRRNEPQANIMSKVASVMEGKELNLEIGVLPATALRSQSLSTLGQMIDSIDGDDERVVGRFAGFPLRYQPQTNSLALQVDLPGASYTPSINFDLGDRKPDTLNNILFDLHQLPLVAEETKTAMEELQEEKLAKKSTTGPKMG